MWYGEEALSLSVNHFSFPQSFDLDSWKSETPIPSNYITVSEELERKKFQSFQFYSYLHVVTFSDYIEFSISLLTTCLSVPTFSTL